MTHNFCVFIISHGRAKHVKTYDLLRKRGYTGEIILVLDNEDPQVEEYKKRFKRVEVFSKKDARYSLKIDVADNFTEVQTPIEARNICFEMAEILGYEYFCVLDDDYKDFRSRRVKEGKLIGIKVVHLDAIFDRMCEFLDCDERIDSISFCQGGDFIGGANNRQAVNCHFYRKCMNSFFCKTERVIRFVSHFNDDVNTYISLGSRGRIFTQTAKVMLSQEETQKNEGGITEAYLKYGTYVKSFTSVMIMPSAVRISVLGNHQRIHHRILWEHCVPKILNEKYKK